MIPLKKLQSELLRGNSLAVPVRIFKGIQGDHLSVSVRHVTEEYSTFLNSPFYVSTEGRIKFMGVWSISEAGSIYQALSQLVSQMELLQQDTLSEDEK